MRELIVVTNILALAVVFVSGLYLPQAGPWSLAGLALGSGWVGISMAALMRLAAPWRDD